MPKEKFLLVSLNESKAKELAQAVSNETCRKILEFLADNETTATELSKELDIPLPTVHYNIQLLQKAGLVASDEYHYSSKGKEVNHYKLANKYIIIAPKSTYGIKEKLKSVLPVAFFIGVASFVLGWANSLMSRTGILGGSMAKEAVESGPLMAEEALYDAGAPVADAIVKDIAPSIFTNAALWFIVGAIAAINVFFWRFNYIGPYWI